MDIDLALRRCRTAISWRYLCGSIPIVVAVVAVAVVAVVGSTGLPFAFVLGQDWRLGLRG